MNSELYPVNVNDRLTLVLSQTLSLDGSATETDGYYDASRHSSKQRSLADEYEYVMYGKVYKFDQKTAPASVTATNNKV